MHFIMNGESLHHTCRSRDGTRQRERRKIHDRIAGNEWPLIQVLTIEEMLADRMPKLPNQVIQQGFRASRAQRTSL
jgi:hypothetical protein